MSNAQPTYLQTIVEPLLYILNNIGRSLRKTLVISFDHLSSWLHFTQNLSDRDCEEALNVIGLFSDNAPLRGVATFRAFRYFVT